MEEWAQAGQNILYYGIKKENANSYNEVKIKQLLEMQNTDFRNKVHLNNLLHCIPRIPHILNPILLKNDNSEKLLGVHCSVYIRIPSGLLHMYKLDAVTS